MIKECPKCILTAPTEQTEWESDHVIDVLICECSILQLKTARRSLPVSTGAN